MSAIYSSDSAFTKSMPKNINPILSYIANILYSLSGFSWLVF